VESVSRHLIALALAAAIGTSPMIMDLCVSCEATHAARGATTAPACHHSPAQTPRLETIPLGCGHDHSGTTMAVTTDSGVTVRTIMVAGLQSPGLAMHLAPPQSIGRLATLPPPDRLTDGLSSTLRI